MTQTRRLAAILAADVAGYSRLIGADEGGTLQRLRAIREELIDPTIARLREVTPEMMVNYPLPFRDPEHRELFLSGLRLAAGEAQ